MSAAKQKAGKPADGKAPPTAGRPAAAPGIPPLLLAKGYDVLGIIGEASYCSG